MHTCHVTSLLICPVVLHDMIIINITIFSLHDTILWPQRYYRLYHICLNKAEDLQDESEVVGFQEDSSTEGGLVNKSNTKLHATLKILWLSA